MVKGLVKERLYHQKVLEESQKELVRFIRWCNRLYGYYPVIIGGWAVWAYTKYSKSIDIDIIIPTLKAVHSLLLPYYKAGHFKSAGLLTKEYFKEVETARGKERIYLDAASYSNRNMLKEKRIEIPWNLLEKNSREFDFGNAKARIPTAELLMLYKVKALRDRRYELRTAQTSMVSGTPTSPAMDFVKSKIKKDENDIRELLKTKIDKRKLDQLLKKTAFKELFDETLNRLEAE